MLKSCRLTIVAGLLITERFLSIVARELRVPEGYTLRLNWVIRPTAQAQSPKLGDRFESVFLLPRAAEELLLLKSDDPIPTRDSTDRWDFATDKGEPGVWETTVIEVEANEMDWLFFEIANVECMEQYLGKTE